jgi:type II secretory ATPase GspE/PulE/Tfp pilus assembly ATPase PilB-like protein
VPTAVQARHGPTNALPRIAQRDILEANGGHQTPHINCRGLQRNALSTGEEIVIVKCRNCRKAYRVPQEHHGIRFRCRDCRTIVDTGNGDGQHADRSAEETSAPETKPASPPPETPKPGGEFADMMSTLRGEMASAVAGWDAAAARRAAEEAEEQDVEGFSGTATETSISRDDVAEEKPEQKTEEEVVRKHHVRIESEEREALRRYKRWDRRFSERLVEQGIISRPRLEEALERSKREQVMLFDLLVREYGISETELTRCRAAINDIEFLESVPETPVPAELFEEIPVAHARRHLFCPLAVTKDEDETPVIELVVCDPRDFVALENVELYTGMRAKATHMATRSVVLAMIERYTGEGSGEHQAMGELVAEVSEQFEPVQAEEVDLRHGITEADGPIVRLANRIIEEAHKHQASDIHVEAEEEHVCVRYRIDGSLEDALTVPGHARRALVTRLKIMSGCNITEHRVPQDGRIAFAKHGGRYDIELRVNTLPTLDDNEDVVIRILADSKPLPLDRIGLLPHVYEPLRQTVERPYGMILCVGPTGSGKTTTLHSLVAHINRREKKILTAENPVEIRQPGLRQVQIRPEVGLDFKSVLRAFLRQDPDVILVGEMRDLETCSIAVEASLTGHLLLSTLHTNNAPETVTRLTEIGIDPVVLSDALLAVLAQRLMKMLCPQCKRPVEPSTAELHEAGLEADADGVICHRGAAYPHAVLYEPSGCEKCQERGFKGRTGVHELLVNSPALKRAIATGASVHELRDLAREEGMRELYDDGMVKVLRGLSSISQLRSVCVG